MLFSLGPGQAARVYPCLEDLALEPGLPETLESWCVYEASETSDRGRLFRVNTYRYGKPRKVMEFYFLF